ncbi:DNRLRE domain-containing protein [Bacillus sp. ISL-57]|uniref:DNRLRE domain-containing protein n=1 Tax=Bacillus sp. ISL-57 TaxID=2819135 RepID=UPI001BEB377A|nr:DNRLRE domain-containing protein [Bacillus sp. ISL-57]MBT2719071.1 DNRLRE domain-containing protein [Bacillus sp. ISL-57]
MGKQRYVKCLIWLLSFLLVFTLIPYEALATTETNQTISDTDKKGNEKENEPTVQKQKKKELPEERTNNSKVYDNGDGTFTKNIYFDPVHIENEGEWQEVSTDLQENKVANQTIIETKNTLLNSTFLEKMNNGEYATFTIENESVSFSILEASGKDGNIPATDVASTITDNKIYHKNIFPDIDLRNITFNENVKEDIILHSYNGINTFTFKLTTDLVAEKEKDGSITFYKNQKNDETIFTLPAPFMTDSNIDPLSTETMSSDDVEYHLKKIEDGYILKVTANEDWLTDPERKYPVYIDPTTSLATASDAFVMSAYPTTNYGTATKKWDASKEQYVLKIGSYDSTTGTNYAFLKQNVSKIDKAVIDSATLNVYVTHAYNATTKNGLWLDEVSGNWDASTLTWDNKPSSTNIGNINAGRDEWVQFNVLNTVKAWAAGTKANNGFKLHVNGNGQDFWKKIVSSDNSTLKPYLSVTYHYDALPAPTVTATSNGTNTETGYLNVSWNKIAGATGYKVLLYNGKDYTAFNVGDVTSWSTKGKKIWPTQTQIDSGSYALSTDNKGTELAFNPNPVYLNAAADGGTYPNSRNYWVRVVAVYPGGDSPQSTATKIYMPMETPKTPTGRPYANTMNEKSGYVNLDWEPVEGADGYKIALYNGIEYEEVASVDKDTTSWTTQNKKLWPTQAQIDAGAYKLNLKGEGTELALDPSPVYRNSKGTYPNSTNYWFKIKAFSDAGHPESSWSGIFKPTIPGAEDFLGMEDFWTGIGVNNGTVNAATGNLIIDETDYSIDGRGPGLSIGRTYNSMSTTKGLFGLGWYSDAEMSIKLESSYIKFIDEDGSIHSFVKKSDGTYEAPTGVYLELTDTTTDFILTSKDQSKVYFDKTTGKIKEIRDAQKESNKTTYGYVDGQLTTITDASGRKLTLEYQNGLVSKITDPKGRSTSYSYNNDQLISVTNSNNEVSKYEYNSNKLLSKVIDPKSTADKLVETSYEYNTSEKRIQKVTNPKGKSTTFAYDLAKRTLTVTNPRGNKSFYEYNAAANPVKQIDAYSPGQTGENYNLESKYEYQGNNLIKSWDPKDVSSTATESFKYDKDGNITSTTDSYGTETYKYNENNDIVELVDTEGEKTTIAYDGLNPTSETDEGRAISSVSKFDDYGNEIESSSALSGANNLVTNSSFEDNLNSWTLTNSNDSSVGSLVTTPEKEFQPLGGKQALKLTTQSTTTGTELGYSSYTQVIPVEPNQTYTFSVDIKTNNLKNAKAFLNVAQLNGSTLVQYNNNKYSALRGTNSWTKRQVTFKTASNVNNVRLYLEVDHNHSTTSGEAWFDRIQLEKADVSSSYNPVINGSFEQGKTGWVLASGSASIVDTESYDGNQSVNMVRTSTTQDRIHYRQTFVLNQSINNPKPISLTAVSKSENVTNSVEKVSNSDYSIWANIKYADGTSESRNTPFPLGTQDWNRAVLYIDAKKAIESIDFYGIFRGNNIGTVWFDAFRLIEGNVLSTVEYDAKKNYAEKTTDVLGRVRLEKYDEVGNIMNETNPEGSKKTYSYDSNNQIKSLSLPNDAVVSYDYDKNGNNTVKGITAESKKQEYNYEYDEDNKLISVSDPLNQKTSYTYDDNDNLVQTHLPNGQFIKNTYDNADRIDKIYYNDDLAFEFVKDKNSNETSIIDSINQLKKEQVFDAKNRITSQVLKKNNTTLGTVSWNYPTDSDKLQSTSFSHQGTDQTISYEYNKLEQNTVVKNNSNTFRLDYDESGNVTTYTPANGVGTTYVYDQAGQVISMSTNKVDAATGAVTTVIDETYTYDANGNRTEIVYNNGSTAQFTYDALDQLTNETLQDGTINEYKYDGFGNRISQKVGSQPAITASYNLMNQLITYGNETIKYDANGNRLEDGTYTYEWNAADQLIAVYKKGDTSPFADYKYDDDGRRIQKNVKGTITNYIYDGDSLNVLYETNASDQVLRSYVYGVDGQLFAFNKHSGTSVLDTYYYHYNPRGDVVALTDKSGNIVASYSYDNWGNPLEIKRTGIALENPFRYAGYQFDEETGLYYLMARYYQPTHGVFLSLDPDPGDEDDILTQNGYNYVGNNPIMMVDPDGHYWHYAAAAGIGAAVQVGKYYYKNRKKSTWKGAGKAALRGAGSGLMWTGAGRALGFISKGKAVMRASKSKKLVGNIKQYGRHSKRLVTNPKKHLKKTPVRRLQGIKKARKNSLKSKLYRASNAIRRR